jgi:hypothetical protein
VAFIAGRATGPRTVVYTAADGTETIRSGGSRSWRNFNPGNIEKGSFANQHGAIGSDDRFAIFPDEATGRDAIVALLDSPSYRPLTLEAAIRRIAHWSGNNVESYIRFVAMDTGLAPQQIVVELSLAQRNAIAASIKMIEGWIEGIERSGR